VIIEEGYSFHKIDIHHPYSGFYNNMSLVTSFYKGAGKKTGIMYTEGNHE